MGDNCDLGLGLAIGGCEFKPVFNHDRKQQLTGQLGILLSPRVKEEFTDREVVVTSKREQAGTTILMMEESSVAKDLSDGAGDDNSSSLTRKKLRLTKDQSSILEDSFRVQQILSSKQKNELAQQLNLKPRQVEVWFQNRRARTKLKQQEVDCEFLKRWCESLTCENERLKRELIELRSIKARAISHNYQNFQATKVINICPSCEKIVSS
ncbi:hypothetical protein LUZ61_002414 [Rhynchospora tenuis]|uniref:Homeobox domain-containing protein n=1 Tax=Rhynchospora tenuis TaxID=198213 RepID=A0AAD6ERS4_9POAL|nr:hypothetical protein LUZ61_002414 [Rhynchospora tenuis]